MIFRQTVYTVNTVSHFMYGASVIKMVWKHIVFRRFPLYGFERNDFRRGV